MSMFRNLIGASLLGASIVVAAPALAAKEKAAAGDLPTIEMTGIKPFDDVFSKAKEIETTVNGMSTSLTTSRTNLNTALGVATDAPVKTALEDLKTKAAGKVGVAMNGTKPTLTAKDGMPDNVKAGLDAGNGLIDAVVKIATDAPTLVPKIQELVEAAKAFPTQVKDPAIIAGVAPKQLLSAPKVLANNGKALAAFPTRIQQLVAETKAIIDDVKAVFGA